MAQSTLVSAQVGQQNPVWCFISICHTQVELMINTDKLDILLPYYKLF